MSIAIERDNGSFFLKGCDLLVHSGLKTSDTADIPEEVIIRRSGRTSEYLELVVTDSFLEFTNCCIQLFFSRSMLSRIEVTLPFDGDPGDSFANAVQEEHLETFKVLVKEHLGKTPPCRFRWGRIDITRDRRSGFTYLTLRYRSKWMQLFLPC